MSRRSLIPLFVLLSAATVAAQDAVGVIADRGASDRQPYAHVFDPASLQVTASVPLPLPNFFPVFDVEISPDLREAYVADFVGAAVWVIDLTTTPPSLAAGTNPIDVVPATAGANGPVSASASDLTITPDGRYLLVSGGNALGDGGAAFGVVELATRQVVDSVDLSPNCPTAIEAGPDGSVVVVELLDSQPSFADTNVRRFRIGPDGSLTDTGDTIGVASIPGVQNVITPSYTQLPRGLERLTARHVLHVSRPAGATFGSLRTNGLASVDTVTLGYPSGIDISFDPLRSLAYVRTNEAPTFGGAGAGNARIEGYWCSPWTGQIYGAPLISISLDRKAGTAFGVEQTAIDPALRRIYVSGLAGPDVRVFDSLTGLQVGTITHPDLRFGLGIKVRRRCL